MNPKIFLRRETIKIKRRYWYGINRRNKDMLRKAAIIVAAVAALATVTTAPAEARWRGGWGPGLAFGLAAGALAAGAYGAYGPYGYGYGYGPRYYGYYGGPGPYAYYGGPYYGPRRYYRYGYW
jgi:hypothetical protein